MRGRARLLIAAAVASVAVAGCQSSNTASDPGGGSDTINGDGSVAFFSAGHRETVGDVSGMTLQGTPLSLSSYRGKVVVVDFWSSDCGPCLGEEDAFVALANSEKAHGVQFVGIDERDNRAEALANEAKYKVTYPSLFDQSDSFLLDFPGSPPSATPFTILLDPTGHIAARVNGVIDYTHLRTLIAKVRADPA